LVLEANQRFRESKARRVYHRAFGPTLGQWLWQATRWTPLRVAGRKALEIGLFRQFRQARKNIFGGAPQ
jgi:hypothetical protein